MKKILINATQKEELRVALVDGNKLFDIDIEYPEDEQKKSNIYVGVISRIEPSLEACFVKYGGLRDGFLSFKDICPHYYDRSKGDIKNQLKEGQKVLVQVEKEERGNKGVALTTYIALAGSYLVLMPYSPDTEGISRRLSNEERDDLKSKLNQLNINKNLGVIVRTAGTGRSLEELRHDLNILTNLWNKIEEAFKNTSGSALLHKESSMILRVLRDYLAYDVQEIIIDSQSIFNTISEYLNMVRPDLVKLVKLYNNKEPLFSFYQIESQIETAFEREVQLPSGGSIVIDSSEALIAIDINSSKSTTGGDIEETALSTNLEAVSEIARQLRLRDLGGLIVIDFIDMQSNANQKRVEDFVKQEMHHDRARIQTTRISKFGLMEMSRQRLKGSLAESSTHVCPRCHGTGKIRDNESLSLSIMRLIYENASKQNTAQIHAIVPVEISSFLLNEKRNEILDIEKHTRTKILIVANNKLETPNFFIHRIRKHEIVNTVSYNLNSFYEDRKKNPTKNYEKAELQKAIVNIDSSDVEKPKVNKPSLLSRLIDRIKSFFAAEPVKKQPKKGKKNNKKKGINPGKKTNNKTQSNNVKASKPNLKTVSVDNKTSEEIVVQDNKAPVVKERRERRKLETKVRIEENSSINTPKQKTKLENKDNSKIEKATKVETKDTKKVREKKPRNKLVIADAQSVGIEVAMSKIVLPLPDEKVKVDIIGKVSINSINYVSESEDPNNETKSSKKHEKNIKKFSDKAKETFSNNKINSKDITKDNNQFNYDQSSRIKGVINSLNKEAEVLERKSRKSEENNLNQLIERKSSEETSKFDLDKTVLTDWLDSVSPVDSKPIYNETNTNVSNNTQTSHQIITNEDSSDIKKTNNKSLSIQQIDNKIDICLKHGTLSKANRHSTSESTTIELSEIVNEKVNYTPWNESSYSFKSEKVSISSPRTHSSSKSKDA